MPPRTTAALVPLDRLPLPAALEGEVEAWSSSGWPGVTQTTHDLLHYWFDRAEEDEERFHICQQRAIETVIYCHEILESPSLAALYERLAPEAIAENLAIDKEVAAVPFPKYCLKMATGTGKTWVLAALLVWQYFNSLNQERPGRYSTHFLLVAPGHEVLNRLEDAFLGRRDATTGERDVMSADFRRALFVPQEPLWRDRFVHGYQFLGPTDVTASSQPPDGPFVLVTNWQQFRLAEKKASVWEQYTGEDLEDQPRGELFLQYLSNCSDLVVMNDEAHHVHGKKSGKEGREELVWRRFISLLRTRIIEEHGASTGTFLQLDFSATPFYGSGPKREYFPHIVYDYDLLQATQDMLVKQLFLEERQVVRGERLADLDFRALRTDKDGQHHRGQISALSAGQKLMLDIGRSKLEQLGREFATGGIAKKPVMLVLAEDTAVADLVLAHFAVLTDEHAHFYDSSRVMAIHSDLKDAELAAARLRLNAIDDDTDPLRVIVSVLMLREGFDKNNICVVVVLRASEADLLLEQVVGRGLRLMFPGYRYPEFQELKREAVDDIRNRRVPRAALDFLFVVEHPRFRQFYDDLKRRGYLIGSGDTSQKSAAGDLIPVYARTDRRDDFDLAWPEQIFEQGSLPDLSRVDPLKLPTYPADLETLRRLANTYIQDRHVASGTKASAWKLNNPYFDYNFFLQTAARAVAQEGKATILSARLAEIMALIDTYASKRLFGTDVDFSVPTNYPVLNLSLVFDHVAQSVRQAVLRALEESQFTVRQGVWRHLSDLEKVFVRTGKYVDVERCLYPRQAVASMGGGYERRFISDVLETSADVLAWAKLDRKHKLTIDYRDEFGIRRTYEPDFVVKTDDSMFIMETKGEQFISSPTVALKARAATAWCERASGVELPPDLEQPQEWEYLILSENLFNDAAGLGFGALADSCRMQRDVVVARSNWKLL